MESKTPLYDNVVVQLIKPTATMESGIVLIKAVLEPVSRGVILAIGEGITHKSGITIPLQVNVGDTVVFGHESADKPWIKMKYNGENTILLREHDIFGIEVV